MRRASVCSPASLNLCERLAKETWLITHRSDKTAMNVMSARVSSVRAHRHPPPGTAERVRIAVSSVLDGTCTSGPAASLGDYSRKSGRRFFENCLGLNSFNSSDDSKFCPLNFTEHQIANGVPHPFVSASLEKHW